NEIGVALAVTKQLFNRVRRLVGIPAKVEGGIASKSRNRQFNRTLGQRLRFVAPEAIEPLQRLDARRRVVLEAAKDNQAVRLRANDLPLCDAKVFSEPVFVYLIFKQLFRGVLNRVLHLSGAYGTDMAAYTIEDQILA